MRSLAPILAVLLLFSCSDLLAKPTITSVQPRTCAPGETIQLMLVGKELGDGLRIVTSNGSAKVKVESSEAEKAVVAITLPDDAPLGPMGMWVASRHGVSEPVVLIVDDLPAVTDNGKNHTAETAQQISTLTAIDGKSDGARSDFYRFQVAKAQRVAFEVLTQELESKLDPVLRLLDSNGKQLRLLDDDEIGPDGRFAYQFDRDGDYLLEIRDNRFAAGGNYHLRIGDFPIVDHAFPLAVRRGEATTIRFVGEDGEQAEPREVKLADDHRGDSTTVATSFPNGRSSAWVPIHVGDLAQSSEDESVETTPETEPRLFSTPFAISGRLTEKGQRDSFQIAGEKGSRVQFQSRTRSLRCATLLQMRLLSAAGNKVAETRVSESDEWIFDYTFPDDEPYTLEVTDLLGRGGQRYGYHIQGMKAERFSIALKADAKTVEQFSIEPETGACVVDLQIQRLGYDGEIELSVSGAADTLEIINPTVPAKAKEFRVYLVATEQWRPDSLAAAQIIARARANPKIQSRLSSLALSRAKKPHVPFPASWDDGLIVMGGVEASEVPWKLEPSTSIQLARPLSNHAATLNLKRTNKEFKSGVSILSNRLPAGWQVATKADKDTYNLSLTQAGKASPEIEQLPLLVYGEFKGRARITKTDLPVQWIDPLQVNIDADQPLVAGSSTKLVATVRRDGGDAQPVTIKPTQIPDGFSVPEAITIAADQTSAEFAIAVPPDAKVADLVVTFEATSKFRGTDFSISGKSPPMPLIPGPKKVEVYPAEIELAGAKEHQQLVVTGFDEHRAPRDWTRDARLGTANPEVAEVNNGVVIPKTNGETEVIVQVGSHRHTIPVRVTAMDTNRRTEFESEVLVALSKQGCNSGACHGSPSGKGMFRLSLRAFDRSLDELTLIREEAGRRVNRIDPEKSLLLLKPLMKVSHGGGKKLRPEDAAYTILRDWIAAGAKADPADTPRCVRLEVYPNEKRVLRRGAGDQQVSVTAHFADGNTRDVTHLVAYESSNTTVATVDQHGLVTPHDRGEAVILVRFLEHIESIPLMFVEEVADYVWNAPAENNYIDQLVNAKLRQLQYLPAGTCTDSEFLRRVSLDVIGILPTVVESEAFLNDPAEDKREKLIDRLLERDEYAKFWALKWGDLLKMTSKLVGDDGVYKYHRWVESAFRDNMPYDQFARELITASGSTLANPPANFYRTATDMNECVETISQVFLGARLQCAKCHNHPFERWTQDNYYGLGSFFHRIQRRKTQRPGELFVWTSESGEVTQPRTGQTMQPWLPETEDVDVDGDADRRQAFARWLVDPANPYFARIEANRIWAQLFSRGIVEPIDDFRDSNPASNGPLLDALAKDFAESGFDRKHLLRTILKSRTYQASYRTNAFNKEDMAYFSHQKPRLLGAEQLLDAVNHATGLTQTLGNLPAGTRATQLPAPDIVKVDFLKVFGQPERSTVCACERAGDSNLGMAIELFNGPVIHEKLRDPKNRFRAAIAAGRSTEDVIGELYMAALCRPPSDTELKAALAHCQQREDAAAAIEDICWALLNTDEFLFQH